jgi:hypothetical protein
VIVQSIEGERPAWLRTVPLPSPLPVTVSDCARLKVGVTTRFWVTVNWHGPLPLLVHGALQPVMVEPPAGVAVSLSDVLAG